MRQMTSLVAEIFSNEDKLFRRDNETFPLNDSSIQRQPLARLFLGEIQKTPRWQPRGCDTQSFRPLVQEE